jgi:23S rRNA U2552 (ribose-2'-O)-methylase RlmE/FtsJ
MKKYDLKKIRIDQNEDFNLYLNKKVFTPNLTTFLLIKASKNLVKKKNKVLELGCGSGIISNYLYKKKLIKKIYASDISRSAVDCSVFNAIRNKAKYEIKKSKLFDSWKKSKFDIIINDISAITTKLNSISRWYDYAPNESGPDGIKFTIKILNEFKKYTNKNGKMLIPIIGLSNKKKILSFMKKKSIMYKKLYSQDWPLPKQFYKHKKFLLNLKKKNIIEFEEKFGFLTTKTEIYCCY